MSDEWKRTLIAPGLSIREWMELRVRLDPATFDGTWDRVISAIERRFAERFSEPANALRTLDATDESAFPEGRGFAMLALDCLLVETLYGYRRGRRTRETSDAFEDFLSKEPSFMADRRLVERVPSFARAVRNGVLHDGETRDGWIIWKGGANGELARPLEDGRVVLYRDAFHNAVQRTFIGYFSELRDPTGPAARDLRSKFRDRVDHLCEESAPPEPGEIETHALPWRAQALPRWSFEQLTARDDRIKHFTADGLALGAALTEKGSWRYLQAMVASCEFDAHVPEDVRRRVEAVRLLHVYGYFQSDFFDRVNGEAALASDFALRSRFISEHSERVMLRNFRSDATTDVPVRSYESLVEALRARGKYPARDGWRLEGAPEFDGSLRGLYLWALGRGLLRAFLDPIWTRARPGIEMSGVIPTEDRGLPRVPEDFATRREAERERWWNETYRPAWEISYLENEVDLRNVFAHPGGNFNRMPNYSADSVRRLFDLVNSLFAKAAPR